MAITMKGRHIDMASMAAKHGHLRAVGAGGRASLNARGDVLGERGEILKTAEQIEADYLAFKRENPNISRPVSVLDADVFESPAAATRAHREQSRAVPAAIPAPKTKKIVNDD